MINSFRVDTTDSPHLGLELVPDKCADLVCSVVPNTIMVSEDLLRLMQEITRIVKESGNCIFYFFTDSRNYYEYFLPFPVASLSYTLWPSSHLYHFPYGGYYVYILRGSFIKPYALKINDKPLYFDVKFLMEDILKQLVPGGSFIVDPFATYHNGKVCVQNDMFYYGLSSSSWVQELLEEEFRGK